MLNLTTKVQGIVKGIENFGKLKDAARNKAIRRGLTKSGQLLTKAIKGKIKTKARRGLLRKSIGQKVKIPRANPRTGAKAKPGYVIIGPRRGFKTQVGTVTRGPRKGQPVYEDPANIAHLVEFGHAGPHSAPPHPFIRPAWDANRQKVFDVMRQEAERLLAEAPRA